MSKFRDVFRADILLIRLIPIIESSPCRANWSVSGIQKCKTDAKAADMVKSPRETVLTGRLILHREGNYGYMPIIYGEIITAGGVTLPAVWCGGTEWDLSIIYSSSLLI